MTVTENSRFSIESVDDVVTITAPAATNLWEFIGPLCWLVFVFGATMPAAAKWIFVALYMLSLWDSICSHYRNDIVVANADSLSLTCYRGFRSHTKVYAAEDIKFVGFYPAFSGGRTQYGVGVIFKSKMSQLLYVQGQEASDVFEELKQIPWLTTKVLTVDREFLLREKDRRPVRAAWSSFKDLMAKPVRFPRL